MACIFSENVIARYPSRGVIYEWKGYLPKLSQGVSHKIHKYFVLSKFMIF
jgi:hypothetical protein